MSNRSVQRSCPGKRSYQRVGPWNAPNSVYFWGGRFSNFASTLGLQLLEGWYGHLRPAQLVLVPTVEHYFQACKAMSREDFQWIMAADDARCAKRRGSPHGERDRRIRLRPDWEHVKVKVMRYACRGKYALPHYRATLLATGARPLVEDSPHDYEWGGRDAAGGYTGMNRLGLVLMEVRGDL